MTNPVQSASGLSPSLTTKTAPPAARSEQPPQAAAPASDFTVEVSRAGTAPVYVYRLTDTATGRVLVEIPNDPSASDASGGKVDAKV